MALLPLSEVEFIACRTEILVFFKNPCKGIRIEAEKSADRVVGALGKVLAGSHVPDGVDDGLTERLV